MNLVKIIFHSMSFCNHKSESKEALDFSSNCSSAGLGSFFFALNKNEARSAWKYSPALISLHLNCAENENWFASIGYHPLRSAGIHAKIKTSSHTNLEMNLIQLLTQNVMNKLVGYLCVFISKLNIEAHCKSERASIVAATCNIAIGFFAEQTSLPCTYSSFRFLKFNKISQQRKENLQCSERFQNSAATPFLSLAMGNLWNDFLFSKFSIYFPKGRK